MNAKQTILELVRSFSGKITINDVPRIISGDYRPDYVWSTDDAERLTKFASSSGLNSANLREIVWELIHADSVSIGSGGILRAGPRETASDTLPSNVSNSERDHGEAVRKRKELGELDAAMILERLAKGCDDHEASEGRLLEDPDIIRALFMGANALRDRTKDQSEISTEKPKTKAKPSKQWSPEEDAELLDAYLSKCPVKELGKRFGVDKSILTTRLVGLLGKERIDQSKSTATNDPATESEAESVHSKSWPSRNGQRWTKDEIQSLAKDYAAGRSVEALAKAHERSAHSIRCRLVLMGIAGFAGEVSGP